MHNRSTGRGASARVWMATWVASAVATSAWATVWVPISRDSKPVEVTRAAPQAPRVVVERADATGIEVLVSLPGLGFLPRQTSGGTFVSAGWPNAPVVGDIGAPGLPVVRRLFLVPEGATVSVSHSLSAAEQLDLQTTGLNGPIEPVQPLIDRDPRTAERAPFHHDAAAYARDELTPTERVTVTEAGMVRDQRLWLLEVRPVAYNPARGVLAVWPEIQVSIRMAGGAGACGDLGPLTLPRDVLLNPPPQQLAGRSRAVNFLVVVASELAATAPLTEFVSAKTAQGYTVTTYSVPAGTTKETIKSYIQNLWRTSNQPNFVLLVGDTNTIPHWFGGGPKTAGTDLPYACMNGSADWYPDIPIGRFSVRTETDLQNVVDKTLYIENGVFSDPSFVNRAVFIAGTDSLCGDEDTHTWVIDTYMRPNEIDVTKLYMRSGNIDTQQVRDAFNAGCLVATYYGHSWGNCWQNGPYFSQADVQGLAIGPVCPLLLQMTCSMGTYWYDDSGCYAEVWQRVANKGAATTVAASTTVYTDPTPWAEVADLEKFTFDAIYRDNVRQVGPAWQSALAALLAKWGAAHGPTRDYFEMFNLFGDPSLRLPEPYAENYLIVTAPTYAGSTPLNSFVAAKQAQGLNVLTYSVPAGTTRDAIKTYIQSLWGTANAPDYLLIVGDTSGSTSTATTIPHWVGVGSKAATTDLPYTCMDPNDDWYPEFPVGRFSVTSVAQLQAVVDKTLFVEADNFSDPNYVQRVAFLANPDTYNTAEPTDEWVITNYLEPRDYQPIRIYAAQGGDTADVTSAVNAGCMMVTYMGHSDSGGWWDPAFEQSNVQALANTGLYPLVFGWSCNSAHFDYDECFGETWQRQANKGAAAYLSATNYVYWGSVEAWRPSGILEKAFFASFFERNIWRVGPAWQSALYQFLDEYGLPATPGGPPTQNSDIIRNFFEEFVLLGDPALLIPQANGFRLTTSPASQNICAPPSVSAPYSIGVEKLGTFTEAVTLSATGQPAGTTVSFSTNSLSPPFTSTMTIGNLDGAAPGAYTLTITGTSASKQKSIQAQLHIASQLPSAPTLLSPADEAVNVARMPSLTWESTAQAANYLVEVSGDSNFTEIVYQATVTSATATVDVNLDAAHTYYWHVLAGSGCGNGPLSETFSFTTISQQDYFTQSFQSAGGFDLANKTLYFIPNNSGSYYHLCSATATKLPTDPNGGTTLSLSDDGSQSVSIGTNRVQLYGVQYGSFWIGANGHLTFSSADTSWEFTLADHFSQPRISPLMDDLTPPTGAVSWKQLSDRVAVTWKNMQEWQSGGSSTFQVELFFNGEIDITWLGITCPHPIVGLSAGGGVPADYVASDLSTYGACAPPGGCCTGTTCTLMYENECVAASGVFRGAGTSCTPNPCIPYDSTCVIISEVVQGAESGSCPRWVELTNTGNADFAFLEGGLIVQTADSNDVTVDVDLTGLVIPAGQSVVVNSNVSGACTGAFHSIYSQTPDFSTNVTFGYGNERLILTDTADGSNLVDIYGEFGVNGTGQPWEFTSGYSYRLSPWRVGRGGTFVPAEWFFGGVGSLTGANPTDLLLALTTPGTHTFDGPCTGQRGDMNCDGVISYADINPFVLALGNQSSYEAAYPACYWINADCNNDGQVSYADINPFVALVSSQ